MPTDLDAATAARKREAQAQTPVCLIIWLGVFVLIVKVVGQP